MSVFRLCVYCGSSSGRSETYLASTERLGQAMAAADIGLVYGGAAIGLMGRLADSVIDAGGEALGVMPQSLAEKEIAHPRLTELHLTSSMHERKALMANLSDGFVALPGGLGTLEELFEIWTWLQLGFHDKPVAIYNLDGFYNQLLAFLDHAAGEGFIKAAHRESLIVADDPGTLIERIRSYQHQPVDKLAGGS